MASQPWSLKTAALEFRPTSYRTYSIGSIAAILPVFGVKARVLACLLLGGSPMPIARKSTYAQPSARVPVSRSSSRPQLASHRVSPVCNLPDRLADYDSREECVH